MIDLNTAPREAEELEEDLEELRANTPDLREAAQHLMDLAGSYHRAGAPWPAELLALAAEHADTFSFRASEESVYALAERAVRALAAGDLQLKPPVREEEP